MNSSAKKELTCYYRISNIGECHYCKQTQLKKSNNTFLAKCCIRHCRQQYCLSCIRSFFNPLFQQAQYRKDTWICYYCQRKCVCECCKTFSTKEKSHYKAKHSIKDKLDEGEKEMTKINVIENKEKVSISIENKEQKQQMQQKEQNLLKMGQKMRQANQKDQFQFSFSSQTQLSSMPPYLRNIMQRKNMFYKFIIQNQQNKQSNNQEEFNKIHKSKPQLQPIIKSLSRK